MIFKKCALGNVVNKFDDRHPYKPEPGFSKTGFTSLSRGKLTPLQPEKHEKRGIWKFMRFFSPQK